jgi:septum formation protein
LLAGKTHLIYTSVAIVDRCGGPGLQIIEQVAVDMRPYGEGEIERYLACRESLDKAGAYSIQGEGRKLIASIQGDYLAAVGMPLRSIAAYLKGRRMTLPVDIDRLYTERNFLNWRSFS